jgi:hypothetical protein
MEAAHRLTVGTFKSRGAVSEYTLANSQVFTISFATITVNRPWSCAMVMRRGYCWFPQDVVFKLKMVGIVF